MIAHVKPDIVAHQVGILVYHLTIVYACSVKLS